MSQPVEPNAEQHPGDETNHLDVSVLTDTPALAKGIEALKEWRELPNVTLIYDSTVDPFTSEDLYRRIVNRPNVSYIAFTSEGDIFGVSLRSPLPSGVRQVQDWNIFVFSFESHGRCETPKMFRPEPNRMGMTFMTFMNDENEFFHTHVRMRGGLAFGNERCATKSWGMSQAFVGLEDTTLTGKGDNERYTCTRLIAVQLSE